MPVTTPAGARRAIAFLGVRPTEERGVALMAAHSFFMGCATVFFETAASATFLARFESSYIPWVYIAAAGVNTLTGATYARVHRRLSFARLMKGTLWFLLAIVLAVRVGFAATSIAWVAFAGLVSYRVLSSLTDLEYWAVASRIYDVRQAKRLFGLIGTGEVIARIAGSFSVPLLVRVGGVSNLMLLSAGALAACLGLLGAVLRTAGGVAPSSSAAVPSGAKESEVARAGLRQILTSPYLKLVVGVAVVATFGKYFVDFAFLEQMSTLSKGEAELAGFLGLFNGLTQTLSLVTRLVVSRPLLSRFGIRVGVMLLPVMHALCTGVTLVVGGLGLGATGVFWLMLANQGLYKTFKHPIDNASFKVLYQPLRAEQRLAAQIAVEVIFAPIVAGLAGGVMLLFSAGMRYDPLRFSLVLLVNFVAWAFLARAAGRAYGGKLLEMLRRRIEGNVVLPFDDATTLSILRARLDSPSPGDVCAALALLEKAEAPDLARILVTKVAHESSEVRRYALERLLEVQPSALPALRRRVSRDPEPRVRGTAIKIVAASAGDAAADELAPYLEDPDALVRRAAVTMLYVLKDERARLVAERTVSSWATSVRSEDRALAARVAGDHARTDIVRAALRDDDFDVRRSAIASAGRLNEPSLRAVLLEQLLDPHTAQSAANALAAQGSAVIPELDARFLPDANPVLLRRLVYVYRLIGGEAGADALKRHLAFDDALVRGRVLAALDRIGFVAQGEERATVFALIREEAHEAAWSLAARRDLAGARDLDALNNALDDEARGARRRVLALLSFVNDRVAVHRVSAHLSGESREKRAYAHEVLDLTLGRALSQELAPLFDGDARVDRSSERLSLEPKTVDERVRELVVRPARFLRDWTRAVAIAAADHRGIAIDVAPWARSMEPLVHAAATHRTLASCDASDAKERRSMLLIEKVILLKSVQMFARTPEELLAEIATILEEVRYRKGQTIFEKGAEGDSMYIVVTGRVRVFDGDTTLSVLGEKEIFGELALLDPEPRSASVEVLEDALLFRLDEDTFTQLMAGNVDIVRGVLHVLCERLRRTSAAAT